MIIGPSVGGTSLNDGAGGVGDGGGIDGNGGGDTLPNGAVGSGVGEGATVAATDVDVGLISTVDSGIVVGGGAMVNVGVAA